MPYYQYTAANKDGKMLHGTIYGMDKADLVAQLASQGLFLVSFVIKEQTPAPAPAAAEAGVSEFRTDDSMSSRRRLSPLQILIAVVVIGAGVGIGAMRAHRHRHPKDTTPELNAKMALIQQSNDPSRAYVESILGKPWSYDPIKRHARYWASSDMGVEIAYTADDHLDKKIGVRVFKKG